MSKISEMVKCEIEELLEEYGVCKHNRKITHQFTEGLIDIIEDDEIVRDRCSECSSEDERELFILGALIVALETCASRPRRRVDQASKEVCGLLDKAISRLRAVHEAASERAVHEH